MDTILFFYRKRGLKEPETEPVGLKRYMLVRVALDVREEEWFGERLGLPEEDGRAGEADGGVKESGAADGRMTRFWGQSERMEDCAAEGAAAQETADSSASRKNFREPRFRRQPERREESAMERAAAQETADSSASRKNFRELRFCRQPERREDAAVESPAAQETAGSSVSRKNSRESRFRRQPERREESAVEGAAAQETADSSASRKNFREPRYRRQSETREDRAEESTVLEKRTGGSAGDFSEDGQRTKENRNDGESQADSMHFRLLERWRENFRGIFRGQSEIREGCAGERSVSEEMTGGSAGNFSEDGQRMKEKRNGRAGSADHGCPRFMPLERWQARRFRRRQIREEQETARREAARRESLLARRQERIRRVEAAMAKLAAETAELAGEENVCFYVYEDDIRKVLVSRGSVGADGRGVEGSGSEELCAAGNRKAEKSRILPLLWQRYFDRKEFREYDSRFWVEQLMEAAVSPCLPMPVGDRKGSGAGFLPGGDRLSVRGEGRPHYVILGTAPCVPEVIEAYADRMKSLRWILTEADCTEEVQEFVEDFYVEYGLAISLQVLSEPGEFRRLRLVCALPCNIIDFTAEPRIDPSGVAAGSIWLDVWSVEEKARRIRGRGTGIACLSMKEKWKYAQRRCNSPVLH